MYYHLSVKIVTDTAAATFVFSEFLIVGQRIVIGLVVVVRFVAGLVAVTFVSIVITTFVVYAGHVFMPLVVTGFVVGTVFVTAFLLPEVFVLAAEPVVFPMFVCIVVELLLLVVLVLVVHVVEPGGLVALLVALGLAKFVADLAVRATVVLGVVICFVRVP